MQEKILDFVRRHNMKVYKNSGNKIHVKQGSHIISRLLGVALTPAQSLPKEVIFEIERLNNETTIKIYIQDGFGTIDSNMDSNYKLMNYVRVLEDRLKQEFNH